MYQMRYLPQGTGWLDSYTVGSKNAASPGSSLEKLIHGLAEKRAETNQNLKLNHGRLHHKENQKHEIFKEQFGW